MRLLLACALFLIWPVAAFSGPKEDAFLVVEQFKKAFDASDVEGVVKLFAPEAVFCQARTGDEDRPDRQVFSGAAAIRATLHHD
jgi:hypothetical protein